VGVDDARTAVVVGGSFVAFGVGGALATVGGAAVAVGTADGGADVAADGGSVLARGTAVAPTMAALTGVEWVAVRPGALAIG
jgi:hypothetical protein